ncbi:MAG: Rsd/AlgQ family anti-sigma factor [Pseudomonadales bacterium]
MEIATETNRRLATATADSYFSQADQSFGQCRQRLISYLVKLNHALNDDLPDLSHALLSRFCDSLVDYLSAGHFRVFQRLSLPGQAYAAIEATTQAGILFNDRFGALAEVRVPEVKAALEQMAQVLSERFELEDQLLYAEIH